MKTNCWTLAVLVAGVSCGLVACGEQGGGQSPGGAQGKPQGTTSQAPAPKAGGESAPAPAAGGEAALGGAIDAAGIVITPPAGWKQVPPSNSMRLAELVATDEADPKKACVAAVSVAGGDVDSNIARWAGQMKDASGGAPNADVHTTEVNGLKVHSVELVGTYQGMSEPAPLPDWMMRGVIVETGAQSVFIKMTGPAESMRKLTEAWNGMINGLKKK